MPKVRIEGGGYDGPFYIDEPHKTIEDYRPDVELDEATIARIKAADAEFDACQKILEAAHDAAWEAKRASEPPPEPLPPNPHARMFAITREMLINDNL